MGTKQETSSQGYAGVQTAYGREGLAALQRYLREVEGMGTPDLGITAQDRALVQQAQEATGESARIGMEQDMQSILRQLEDTAIGRGIEGSSLEAVNNALVGQQFQQQLAQLALQQQAQGSQALMNMPFQRAQAENQGNLARFQMLTGAAQPMVNYDALLRQLTASQKGVTKGSALPGIMGMAMRGGMAYMTGGMSEAAQVGNAAYQPGAANNPYYGPGY